MRFKLTATFEANDLDDAFYKLSKHFLQLAADSEETTFDEPGTEFNLEPTTDTTLLEGVDNGKN